MKIIHIIVYNCYSCLIGILFCQLTTIQAAGNDQPNTLSPSCASLNHHKTHLINGKQYPFIKVTFTYDLIAYLRHLKEKKSDSSALLNQNSIYSLLPTVVASYVSLHSRKLFPKEMLLLIVQYIHQSDSLLSVNKLLNHIAPHHDATISLYPTHGQLKEKMGPLFQHLIPKNLFQVASGYHEPSLSKGEEGVWENLLLVIEELAPALKILLTVQNDIPKKVSVRLVQIEPSEPIILFLYKEITNKLGIGVPHLEEVLGNKTEKRYRNYFTLIQKHYPNYPKKVFAFNHTLAPQVEFYPTYPVQYSPEEYKDLQRHMYRAADRAYYKLPYYRIEDDCIYAEWIFIFPYIRSSYCYCCDVMLTRLDQNKKIYYIENLHILPNKFSTLSQFIYFYAIPYLVINKVKWSTSGKLEIALKNFATSHG